MNHKDHDVDVNQPEDVRHALLRDYINNHRNDFKEWYMPILLGENRIYARTYPTFQDRPESIRDNTCGQLKWDFIIKKNLPDLTNKIICDVGCNAGIFSLHMSEMGACRVLGFDRGMGMVQANNHHLGDQSVAQQAYMVRNMYELYYGKKYPRVEFWDCDLMLIDYTELDGYDLFFSCCTLYHFGEERMRQVIKDVSTCVPEIFLQANQGHGGELGRISNLDYHVKLLTDNQYKIITVDAPPGYPHPVVYARK